VRRREFFALLGGTAIWPVVARAQPGDRLRRVGVLLAYLASDTQVQTWTKALETSLQELGWTSGRNIQLDYRWAGPDPDRLRAAAEELVRLSPDILLPVATPALIAAQHATGSIPIVFANVGDPVGQGLIASFARPGGNTTGFGVFDFSMAGKWMQAIKEIAPALTRIGVIYNPETGPYYASFLPFVETASGPLGVKTVSIAIHKPDLIKQTLETLAEEPSTGVIVLPSSMFSTYRDVIIANVARLRLPAVYPYSFFAQSGGLLSYGADVREMLKQAGGYGDRILRGAKFSDLPAQLPTKCELIVNVKTAKALGLTVQPTLLDRADEVIE
jgi:putative tryptophan/tyrosine transport system substrate-binding protein